MNPIETLERDIQRAVPEAWTRLRRPRNPEGEWWLDAKKDEHIVTIQWSSRRGFGISASALDEGYGEGPEETESNSERATARVVQLLRTRSHTVPPPAVLLRELRALVGLTQEQLAERLGVQQAAVSRLERREDMTLSSLKKFVAALGAELEISIRTPSGEQLVLTEPRKAKNRASCGHLDLLDPVGSGPGLPFESCRTWLAHFESTARSKWSLAVPRLYLAGECEETLATSNAADGRIMLSARRSWHLSRRLHATRRNHTVESPEAIFLAVLRHVLAHEVGHFIEDDALRTCNGFRALTDPELAADAIAGWFAGQAGDDAFLGSVLSSHLGCRAEDCSYPTPEQRTYAYLLGHFQGTKDKDNAPTMNLLVIRTLDLERSRVFYKGLGLAFRAERHGEGPLHYSCDVSGTTIELYPTTKPTGGVRLGLRIPTPRAALAELVSSGLLLEQPAFVERRCGPNVCVVRDPDGNAVELEMAT